MLQTQLFQSVYSQIMPMNYNLLLQNMSRLESLHQEIATRYTYQPNTPINEKQNYLVYDAVQKELNIPVTLKIVLNYPPELAKYLKKLKDLKVQNTIKIYELYQSPDGLFIATEQVTYSHLKNALLKCRKLDDFDAIFLCKIILTANVDLIKYGFNWFGSDQDIQFTENGLRLSWNNSIPYETENPFPFILSKLAGQINEGPIEQTILPFPRSKVLTDLLNISGQSASQISLNSTMKKKEKLSKRRGRTWICLKQYKNDLEYYEETVYFAVHKEIGFARVKAYNIGEINQDLINLNISKSTFTKVIDTYTEQGRTYIISEYSNDGSLFNYVNKLKANSIALKEQQIQFFFYSLFQPLKLIQDSTIKSLCMLHIKNIYIENGIPKIGEPVPMNRDLKEQLKEKKDVPDFYHPLFKQNPDNKKNIFDTYSLGVLMYKLMYTQYPIFPQGKVHIPTTPNYNKRLKFTLQLLLNEGGLLKQLEKKIEVSEQVAKQVRINKGKLLQQKKGRRKLREGVKIEQFQDEQIQKQSAKKEDGNTEGHEQQFISYEQNQQCCKLCCAQLDDDTKHKSIMLDSLEESPYASYRLCTKVLCIFILYLFLFYFFFIQHSLSILSNYSSLQRLNVTISTVNYEISTSDSNEFYKRFNLTNRSVASLVNTGCYINNYNGGPDYTPQASNISYFIYIISSLASITILLIFKGIQLAKFDFIKTLYNMSNIKANFNMSNYLLFNFIFCSLVNDHFIFYNQIFETLSPICLGTTPTYYYGSTNTFFSDPTIFVIVFMTTYILHFVVILLHLIMITKTESIRYTRLFNPILIFLPLLVGYTVVARVGVVSSYFYPSLITNIDIYGNYFSKIAYIDVIGIIPEILFLIEFFIEFLIDWIFWLTFDKRRRMLINDISSAAIIV